MDDDGDKNFRATNKAKDSKGLLGAKKTWKENRKPDENSFNYWVDVETEDKFDKKSLRETQGRYKSDLSERGVQPFVTQWRGAENEGQREMTELDRSLMNRFVVETSFIKWNWDFNKRFESKMNFLRKRRDSETSALYALDDVKGEATRINEYGETDLKGGIVDAVGKVS